MKIHLMCLVGLAGFTLPVFGESDPSYPYAGVRQKTIQREGQGLIRTVWPDLRLDGPYSQAAMPLLGFGGSFRLDATSERVIRKGVTDPDSGRRRTLTATLEQVAVPGRLWGETSLTGYDAGDSQSGLGEWSGRVVINLWKSRYQAVSLALGSAVAIERGSDLDLQHAEPWSLPTYQLAGRYSGAIGFWTLTANLAFEYQPQASNVLEDPLVDEDGNTAVTTGKRWDHVYGRVSVPLGVSYRAFRWLRIGVDSGIFVASWKGEEDSVAILDRGIPVQVYVDANPVRMLRLRVGAGYDPTDAREVSDSLRLWSAHAGLQVHW